MPAILPGFAGSEVDSGSPTVASPDGSALVKLVMVVPSSVTVTTYAIYVSAGSIGSGVTVSLASDGIVLAKVSDTAGETGSGSASVEELEEGLGLELDV